MATVKNKLLSLIFLASVMLLCVSCQSDPPQSEPAEESTVETEHVHSPVSLPDVPPTCEADGHTGGIQCSTCKYYIELPVSVEKLGHTCETGVCERCGKVIRYGAIAPETGIWKSGVYNDEFGDPTEFHVVFSDPISGTFSNSATNGSKLAVIVYAEQHRIKIELFEYEKLPVTYTLYSYEVHIKHGEIKETMYVNLDDGVLLFDYDNFTKIKYILSSGEDIQFVIYESGGTSTYKFTVSASNFFAKYMNTFPPSIAGSLPIGVIPLSKTDVMNSFQEVIDDYPLISSFDASTMLKIYDYIVDETVMCVLRGRSPSEEREQFYIKAAKEFHITPEQAELIDDFVGTNHDLVKSVSEYE